MRISYNIKNGNIVLNQFDSNTVTIDLPIDINVYKKIFTGCSQHSVDLYKNKDKMVHFKYDPSVLDREIYNGQAVFKPGNLVKNPEFTELIKEYNIISFKENPELFTIKDILTEFILEYLNDSDFDSATYDLISSVPIIDGKFDILAKSYVSIPPKGNCKLKVKLDKRIKEFNFVINNPSLSIQVNDIEYPKKINKIVLDNAENELTLIINNETDKIQTLNYLFILFNDFEEVL